MIKFAGVSRGFSGRPVLKELSFEIEEDEAVAVLGPSGSGKTTLLRLICGIIRPDAGSIEVASQKIGYVFQDHRLLPWQNARENIELVLKARGVPGKEAAARAEGWLERLGLKSYGDYYPGQLSGGMAQRVSIARAFAIQPDIMLLDEPFSSLDAALADSLLRDLRQVLAETRTTTVYVSHDYVGALSMARRLFHLGPQGFQETAVADRPAMIREYLTRRLDQLGE